ncbi:MAG: DUF3102 domain-containing protein [Synechococcales cyanobacterium CRU_2_2]|nr:DUF3102 domain-containing protein [Synechococcales cyanobacterium CRU_2_2]
MGRPKHQSQLNTLFDYASLQVADRQVIEKCTLEIRDRLRRSAQDILEIGQRLAEVRSHLQYGQFLTWLNTEFGWSQRTAYNFINVYETFGDKVAKLAKVDIATSVLYRLASPSVSEELRAEVLEEAQSGKNITNKAFKQMLEQRQQTKQVFGNSLDQSRHPSEMLEASSSENQRHAPEIRVVIPQIVQHPSPVAQPLVSLQSDWYQLGDNHLIFCGDTASPAFVHCAPAAKLAIAFTEEDWGHDWLVEQVDRIVVLPERDSRPETFQQLVQLLSHPGDILILPWLPFASMVAIAHRLGRKVYAGDPEAKRCERAIAASGLKPTPTSAECVCGLVV